MGCCYSDPQPPPLKVCACGATFATTAEWVDHIHHEHFGAKKYARTNTAAPPAASGIVVDPSPASAAKPALVPERSAQVSDRSRWWADRLAEVEATLGALERPPATQAAQSISSPATGSKPYACKFCHADLPTRIQLAKHMGRCPKRTTATTKDTTAPIHPTAHSPEELLAAITATSPSMYPDAPVHYAAYPDNAATPAQVQL